MTITKTFAGVVALSLAVAVAMPIITSSEAFAQSRNNGPSPTSGTSSTNPGSGPSDNPSNPIFYYQDCPRRVHCSKPLIPKEKMPALCRSYYHQVTDGTWVNECKKYYENDD